MKRMMKKSRLLPLVFTFFALTASAQAQSMCEIEAWDRFWSDDYDYQTRLDLYIDSYSTCQYYCGTTLQLTGPAYDQCVVACREDTLDGWHNAQYTLWETAATMDWCNYEMDFCNNASARRSNCEIAWPDHTSDPYQAEQYWACVEASGIWSCQ